MTAKQDGAQEAKWLRWRSVADLYHAYFTGLILTVVTRRGTADAAEFVFRVFRRQQQERFLPGLEKLGLSGLPPAMAAAQYHYLSNWIGGVSVEYMYEIRPQGLDPLSAAALDLARHRDLRRARRSLARDAARLARQQWRIARQSKTWFCLHQAERRRTGRARRLLLRIRPCARCRPAPGVRAPSGSADLRCGERAGTADIELAEAAAGKGLSQLRDGICADRGAGGGATVRA